MNRRGQLVRFTFAIAVAASFLTGCATTRPVEQTPGMLTVRSGPAEGHVHTIVISLSDIAYPPAEGVDRETSESDGHRHHVTLSADELRAINDGKIVEKESSLLGNHMHVFKFNKADAAAAPAQQ